MSEISGRKCDGCGKTTLDRYEEKGWIEFASAMGGIAITRSAGRAPDRQASTDYLPNVRDFCSLECLGNQLDAMATKRAAAAPKKKRR